jgi:methionyl-tRNA synthetase
LSDAPRYYITCAIDYANGNPHIGHAIEKIGGDAMARYHRLKGEHVHFLVGLDEHGLKVLQSANAEGISPQEWVDRIAESFLTTWRQLDVAHDDFIRTSEPRHRRAVEEMIRRLQAADDLYKAKYAGNYCVGCEAFKRGDELSTDESGTLRCPIHPTRDIVWSEEENWFFRLSRYQDRLLELINQRPEFIQPEIRRNEIRRVIEGGLEDISVSRANLSWGIPWPGEAGTTVYVWIDALTNYISAIGFPANRYLEYWPAAWHVIGKDITRFHCIYWPAMLMSAGVDVPRSVWGHGFITFGGAKLSKSDSDVRIELNDAIERHGADALRYFLLKDIPWNGDGEFSWERFDERYTADLANNFGNLANRVISMIERYREGTVPNAASTRMDEQTAATLVRYRTAMDENLLHHGAAAAMELSSAANGYIEEMAPWSLAKAATPDAAQKLDEVLGSLARAVAALCMLLEPFTPGKMRDLAGRLGLQRVPLLAEIAQLDLAGNRVQRGDVLFPRLVS